LKKGWKGNEELNGGVKKQDCEKHNKAHGDGKYKSGVGDVVCKLLEYEM